MIYGYIEHVIIAFCKDMNIWLYSAKRIYIYLNHTVNVLIAFKSVILD